MSSKICDRFTFLSGAEIPPDTHQDCALTIQSDRMSTSKQVNGHTLSARRGAADPPPHQSVQAIRLLFAQFGPLMVLSSGRGTPDSHVT